MHGKEVTYVAVDVPYVLVKFHRSPMYLHTALPTNTANQPTNQPPSGTGQVHTVPVFAERCARECRVPTARVHTHDGVDGAARDRQHGGASNEHGRRKGSGRLRCRARHARGEGRALATHTRRRQVLL